MKTYLTLLLLLICGTCSLAQDTRITGTIKTAKGVAIPNASIAVKNTFDGASSDSTGRFSFNTSEKGKQVITFSAIGFGADSLQADLAGGTHELKLVLDEKLTELDVVSITAGTFEAGDNKKNVVLNSLDVATTAGATADIFAALQTLPGTQTSFSENGLFVRGGAAAETKTFFDGMLVKSPFNTQVPDQASRGRFSPFLFKGTSFSAGAYSAQYGQALSSALVLESKDLAEKTTTGVSLLSAGLGLDHTQRFKNSSLAAETFYYNLRPAFTIIKQKTDWDKMPEQYGGTLNYKLNTSETGMFKAFAQLSRSVLSLYTSNLDDPAAKKYFDNDNKNVYLNSTYQEYLGSKWKLQGGVAYSSNHDEGLQSAENYTRTDRNLQGRVTVTNYTGSLSTIKAGVETMYTGRNEGLGGRSHKYHDQLSAAFAETDLFFTPKLVARLGLRTEYSSYMQLFNLAPRTSLGYKTGAHSQVSVAYGRFYQNPEDDYLILQPLDFEQADHYLANYQYMGNGRIFRAEAYYKNYDRLVKTGSTLPENTGDGYAKGIDLFWRDKKTLKNSDYWISYSFLDTRRNFRDYPISATPPFAAKHTMSVVYKKFIDKLQTQLSTTYTFASGRTYVNPNNAAYLADKTRAFNNLSLTASYLTHILRQFTVVYVAANNVPGFRNVYGYQYSANGQMRKAIGPPARRDLFIGLLMTLGDNTFVR
ncbi:TonB-dependent receptor [Hufsiella ginkgonis]|uniref:TonB-dependent receptor n=1 Tax=Hufsiella ginkgonis TaxID=2695274 RepID=A0A7K1XVP0_9SPHI|nr:carboxypeptidase-like regulatory domain-containing protein [Hufsiella ginkgonis]MXV14586.1 TonB-dependent receptor [Hufsiella ginkgonis]